MAPEIDYAAVIADLEARRARLEAAIETIRQEILGVQPSENGFKQVSGQLNVSAETPTEVVPGTFHGLSIAESAKRFLQMTKTKKKTGEICEALRAGGIESSSKNFYGNVYTRMGRDKDFVKLGNYWGLAAWYPNRQAPPPPKPKGKRKGKANRKKVATTPKKTEKSAASKKPTGPTLFSTADASPASAQ